MIKNKSNFYFLPHRFSKATELTTSVGQVGAGADSINFFLFLSTFIQMSESIGYLGQI